MEMKKLHPIDKFLQKYGETGTVCDENSDIWDKVARCLKVTGDAYGVMAIREVTIKYDGGEDKKHFCVMLHGGNNGNGIWNVYLKNILSVFEELSCTFADSWLMELDNDCLDDVHYVYLGIR